MRQHMHASPITPPWNLARRFRWVSAVLIGILIFLHEHATGAGPIARGLRGWIERRVRRHERTLRYLIVFAAFRRIAFVKRHQRKGGAPARRMRMTKRAIRVLAGLRLPPRGTRARIEALAGIAADPEPYIARLVRRIVMARGFKRIRQGVRERIAPLHLAPAQFAPPVALRNSS